MYSFLQWLDTHQYIFRPKTVQFAQYNTTEILSAWYQETVCSWKSKNGLHLNNCQGEKYRGFPTAIITLPTTFGLASGTGPIATLNCSMEINTLGTDRMITS